MTSDSTVSAADTRARRIAAWSRAHHPLIAFGLLLVCFVPLLGMSRYNYPAGDDYANVVVAQQLGTVGAVRWWYVNWTGRYASFFFQSLYPRFDSWLLAYTLVPIALFLIGFGCLFAFVRAAFGPRFARTEIFTFSALAYIFLVGLTPDMATGFYWMPTNMQYLGAVFLTLLVLALHIDLERASSPVGRAFLMVIAIALIAVLAGLNEISIILFIAVMASVSFVRFRSSGRIPAVSLTLLIASILFALVSLLAPGNVVRATETPSPTHWLTGVLSGLGLTVSLVVDLLSVPTLLLGSMLYLAFLERNRHRLEHVSSCVAAFRSRWMLVLMICIFSVVNVVVCTAVGMHSLAERVKNVHIYSLVIAWFFCLTVLFAGSAGVTFSIPRWIAVLLIASLAIFLLTGFDFEVRLGSAAPSATRMQRVFSRVRTNSIYTNAYLDILSGRAARYARQNEEISARFRAANGDCVDIPPPADRPETIFVDFVKYPQRWCAREFYLRLRGDSSP